MPKKRPGVILTDKQWKFCNEYVVDLCGTNAAIRAGYSEHSARSTASHLLDNADIWAYIRKLQEDDFLIMRITRREILGEMARMAFSDAGEIEELNTRDEGEGRGTRERRIQEDSRLTDGQESEYKENTSNEDEGRGDGSATLTTANECEGMTEEVEAVVEPAKRVDKSLQGSESVTPIEVYGAQQAALSYRKVTVDPKTGCRTTITFSAQTKMTALRMLGIYAGIFVKGAVKADRNVIKIVRPRE